MKRSLRCALSLVIGVGFVAGCGGGPGGQSNTGGSSSGPVSISAIAGPDYLQIGVKSPSTYVYSATVTGSSDKAIEWSVDDASLASIDLQSGVATPSSTQTGRVTITAKAHADPSKTATFQVNVVDWILADYDAYLINPEGGLNGSLLPISDSWEYCSWNWDHLRFICPDAFAQQPTTFNVFQTDGTAAGTKQVATIDFSRFSGLMWVGYPRYSPDGTKIAFLGSGANGLSFYTGIMVIDSGGTEAPTMIAADPDFLDTTEPKPRFTPDGTEIIFGMSSGLWIVKADGTNLRQLASPPAVAGMFARDSSALYYSANGCIFKANTDGTNPVCVFQDTADLELMDVSPNGRRFVFAEPPGGGIYVVNVDGTNLQQTDGLQSASW